jgi:hypothetical protein
MTLPDWRTLRNTQDILGGRDTGSSGSRNPSWHDDGALMALSAHSPVIPLVNRSGIGLLML